MSSIKNISEFHSHERRRIEKNTAISEWGRRDGFLCGWNISMDFERKWRFFKMFVFIDDEDLLANEKKENFWKYKQ
jgi:hypothetical protein